MPEVQKVEMDKLSQERESPAHLKKPPMAFYIMLGILACGATLLLALGVLPRISNSKMLDKEEQRIAQTVLELPAVRVSKAPPVQELTLPANIEPIQEIPIYARTDGFLKRRYVNIGDKVKTNQVLLEVETPEVMQQLKEAQAEHKQALSQLKSAQAELAQSKASLATQKANVKKAQADLALAESQVKRYDDLAKEGAISLEQRDMKQRDVDACKALIEQANANVTAAKAQMEAYEERISAARATVESGKAKEERFKSLVSFQSIKAPCDGVITACNVDDGALITSGSSTNANVLIQMARTSTLRVYAYVPQSFYRYIHAGMPTEITVSELPGQIFAGTVTHVSGGLNQESRTLLCEVVIPNKDGKLMSGMYAQVKFSIHRDDSPVIIPSSSLVVRGDDVNVVVVEDNKARFSKITLGRDYGKEVEVQTGLKDGEIVLKDPPVDVEDGDQIIAKVVTEKISDKKR
ncbi:MAG: efflux RND transporter periplasmic adaptor subunit [Cyanobacteria bacterium TGS_CYA1]|nr:efflux RND transporter periplasmic adaptor subunit [Cyanobacteria bacterium TGS_CYA1]